MSTALAKIDPETVAKMDETLTEQQTALTEKRGKTFQTAMITAQAMITLREMFDQPGIMDAMVMPLCGSALGFRTDRDDKPPAEQYKPEELKDPIIQGLLTGAQLTGNEINVIAKGCYLTKEFFQRGLADMDGLDYKVVHGVPRNADKGAVIKSKITYTYKGKTDSEELELAIKGDKYTSVDGYRGKADRKARAWLYQRLTGINVADADVDDRDAIPVTAKDVTHPMEKEPPPAEYLEWVRGCDPRKLKKYLTVKGLIVPGQSVEDISPEHIETIMSDPALAAKAVKDV